MEVRIEVADLADAPEILAMQHKAYVRDAQLYPEAPIPPITDTLADITRDMGRCLYLRAVAPDGEIVGAVRGYLADGTCHVGRLMVTPRLHGQGLGRRLLAAIEEFMPKARRFELFTGDRSERNQRIYLRAGYTEIRREPEAGTGIILVYLAKERHMPQA